MCNEAVESRQGRTMIIKNKQVIHILERMQTYLW